jgi:hypothetical protein
LKGYDAMKKSYEAALTEIDRLSSMLTERTAELERYHKKAKSVQFKYDRIVTALRRYENAENADNNVAISKEELVRPGELREYGVADGYPDAHALAVSGSEYSQGVAVNVSRVRTYTGPTRQLTASQVGFSLTQSWCCRPFKDAAAFVGDFIYRSKELTLLWNSELCVRPACGPLGTWVTVHCCGDFASLAESQPRVGAGC